VTARADRFPLMDSLRAIAFLMVFVTHTAFFAGMLGDGSTLRPYVARLDSGVRVFFLISAFLLYRPFVAARLRGQPPPYAGAYAWRRFLRVAPPYWLALAVVALWLGVAGIWDHALVYFGFAHVYDSATVGLAPLPQAWSLCVEVAFYAFLPLWAAAMRALPARDARARLRLELIGCAVLFALSAAYKAWILGKGAPTDPGVLPWHFALPAFLDYFAIGMAIAALSVWHQGRERESLWLRVLDARPSIAWLAAAVALVVAARGIGLTGALDDRVSDRIFFERHYLYALIAVGLILPAVWGDPARGLVRRLLANRVLLWIGMVSYGAYLFHFAVLIQLRDWDFGRLAGDTTAYAWYAVGIAAALAVAAVVWYCVERPVMRLRTLVPAREVERGEATLEPTAGPAESLARSGSP
jgi:peptidoglycan/LPS O-acetylase OafA/YrhL